MLENRCLRYQTKTKPMGCHHTDRSMHDPSVIAQTTTNQPGKKKKKKQGWNYCVMKDGEKVRLAPCTNNLPAPAPLK